MPIFIQCSPDPFVKTFSSVTEEMKSENRSGGNVRRPLRGIELKEETFASLQVRTADGQIIFLTDAGGEKDKETLSMTSKFSNFFLQGISESRAEKSQIVETFGEAVIFFLGEQPRILSCQGVLLNTKDFNWAAEFFDNYDKFLRGTKCVENKARVYLSWDDQVVGGYVLKTDASRESSNDNIINFSFQMFLTNEHNISNIGLSDLPKAQEFQLDPSSLDTTGRKIGQAVGSTAAVRKANVSNFGQKSLLQTLRNGILNADAVINGINLQINDLFYGRRVRVPAGFSEDYNDIQLAAGSFDPGNLNSDRVVNISNKIFGLDFTTRISFGVKSMPAKYGKLQLNTDEYIAGDLSDRADMSIIKSVSQSDMQTNPTKSTRDKIKTIFDKFGLKTDPPSKLVNYAAKGAFGVISILGGGAMMEGTR